MFCVAKMNEQATNARQRSLVRSICVSGLVYFFLTVGIRSTATADAEVRTTASSVDIDAERIINEPFILTEYGQGYRRVLDKELAKISLEIVPVLEIGRTDIITTTVAHSNMISFLPDFVTKNFIDSGELCYLDVCDIKLDIWKQLIYHKNKWLSKSLKTVIDYIILNDFGS